MEAEIFNMTETQKEKNGDVNNNNNADTNPNVDNDDDEGGWRSYSKEKKKSPNGANDRVGRRCYVGNLSFETSWQTLKDYMRSAGNVLHADIIRDNYGRSRGCGIVEFETPEEAENAIKTLNNTELDGRLIFIREDREPARPRWRPNYSARRGPPRSRDDRGRRLFIDNLPYETAWQDLKDAFRQCGDVIRADILQTPDGRSKGQGIVIYETREAALKAIQQFNRKEFNGRIITVREDRYA